MLDTLVIDTHPVDNGLILSQTETSGFWIPLLLPRGQGTYFNETETKVGYSVECVSVLVESCRQADRVGELDSKHLPFQNRFSVVVEQPYQIRNNWNLIQQLDSGYSKVVDLFRLPEKQYASY